MQQIVVAITHQTPSQSEQLKLLAQQRVAIGTRIKGKHTAELSKEEKDDVALLDQLGSEGGIAVVTYGKNNQRWLCRFTSDTPVELFGELRSLKAAETKELPPALGHVNTYRGNAIRRLTGVEAAAVLDEATGVFACVRTHK